MAARWRRRLGRGLLLLALVLLLLLGRGLGLLPTWGGGAAESGPAPEARDHAAALRSLLRSELGSGRLGAAFAVLERQEQAGAGRGQQARELARQLQARLDADVADLLREVDAGEILAAHARLRLLVEPPAAAVRKALDGACAARGWPSLASPSRAPGEVPAALPLAPERVVRARLPDGRIVRSRIVAQDGSGATLRCAGPEGVTFPRVAGFALEPEAVTAGEAAELGFAALGAGEVAVARLWCAAALARAPAPPERLLRLRALLGD